MLTGLLRRAVFASVIVQLATAVPLVTTETVANSTDSLIPICADNQYHLNGRCCESCPKGQQFVRGCSEGQQTQCVACTIGHAYKTSPGGDSFNCKCPSEYFFNETLGRCQLCEFCNAGTGAARSCGFKTNSVCEVCAAGTYSHIASPYQGCHRCTACMPYQDVVQECTSTQNTKCEDDPVKKGKWDSMGRASRTTVPGEIPSGPQQGSTVPIYISIMGAVIIAAVAYVLIRHCRNNGKLNWCDTRADRQNSPGSDLQKKPMNAALLPPSKHLDKEPVPATIVVMTASGPQSRPVYPAYSDKLLEEPVSKQTRFRELPKRRKRALEEQLFRTDGGRRDWTQLAKELGYSTSNISDFECRAEQEPRQSPIRLLFQDWARASNSHATCGNLVKSLRSCGRSDVARLLPIYDETASSCSTAGTHSYV